MVVHVVVVAAGVVGGAANGTKSPVGHKRLKRLTPKNKQIRNAIPLNKHILKVYIVGGGGQMEFTLKVYLQQLNFKALFSPALIAFPKKM